jgi:D-Tyr-tRNA(Tyr) deacylase
MRAVVQRVTRAKVTVDGEIVGEIEKGLVVLLGVATDDTVSDVNYLAEKIIALRICDDAEGKMNLSVRETVGSLLFFLVPGLLVAFGSYRHALRSSTVGCVMLVLGTLFLVVMIFVHTLGGVFYLTGIRALVSSYGHSQLSFPGSLCFFNGKAQLTRRSNRQR